MSRCHIIGAEVKLNRHAVCKELIHTLIRLLTKLYTECAYTLVFAVINEEILLLFICLQVHLRQRRRRRNKRNSQQKKQSQRRGRGKQRRPLRPRRRQTGSRLLCPFCVNSSKIQDSTNFKSFNKFTLSCLFGINFLSLQSKIHSNAT